MSTWKIKLIGKKPHLKNPVLIEGLPGIGNVGKVAVDFMVDKLKAKKLYDIFSYTFPHSVFVNENNLVELPSIGIYYKKMKKQDLLFLIGDVQPVDEVSSYEFSDKVLELAADFKCKEVITLGGIGLQEIPKEPKVYCTANSKNIIKRYKNGVKLNERLYGIVGPIIGVSGLLVGLAKKKKIEAIAFLAETYGHPMYLGIKGSKEILKIFNRKFGINLKLEDLDKEIQEIEAEMIKRAKDLENVTKQTALKKFKSKFGDSVDYIG